MLIYDLTNAGWTQILEYITSNIPKYCTMYKDI